MDNANYVKPERCEVCGFNHEPEYPHVYTKLFEKNFIENNKRQPVIDDTYSHCKGIIFESAEAVFK